jgi:PH (Pleckstrin Homology) domain-containing protein
VTLLRKAVAYETAMWRSLFQWVRRRPATTEPGAETFSYAGMVSTILWAIIAASAVEIPIVHLILPWRAAEIVALVLGVYGLLWMFGLMASLKVRPHVVGPAGLRVRNGVSLDLTIPWEQVAAVRKRHRTLEYGKTLRVEEEKHGKVQYIAMSNHTAVDVVFREPTVVHLPKGPSEPVVELRFYADDPDALAAKAREHLTTDAPAGAQPTGAQPTGAQPTGAQPTRSGLK